MDISRFYTGGEGCGHDHPEPTIVATDLSTWTKMIKQIAKDLFDGKLLPINFHKGLIEKTYKELNTAAAEGFGATYKTHSVGKLMQAHIFRFSVAKTYHQLAEMQSFLVDDKGKLRSFSDFKKEVDTVHENYNRTYLNAEYRTAKRSAQAARQWGEYEAGKDLFPNLIYRTVGDDKVRDEHRKLDGIIRPIDDEFWDTYYPPNDWQCRCSVQATAEAATKAPKGIKIAQVFKNNVAKTGQAFAENGHPYFDMPKDAEKAYKKYLDGEEK